MSWATLSAAANRVAFNRLGAVSVTAGGVSGQGFLKMPSEYINEGRAITDEYGLHVEAAKFRDLTYDDPITVAGEPFTVRERPMLLDDGTFCLVLLTKVTPETMPTPQRPISERRVDTSTTGIIYIGQAVHGAAESSPIWTVTRTTYNAAGVRQSKATATGIAWTGRASATYS